ncbi:MAG: hypothetical protein AAF488_19790 [Planctomycetota bacterium]
MSSAGRIREIEVYRDIPIVEFSYSEPMLLTAETHCEQLLTLLEYEAERFSVIVDYNNISCSNQYGPHDQVKIFELPQLADFEDRIISMSRYHARSLTALVSTMSAHSLLQQGASNFAPDLDTAVRAARRSIDHDLAYQRENA